MVLMFISYFYFTLFKLCVIYIFMLFIFYFNLYTFIFIEVWPNFKDFRYLNSLRYRLLYGFDKCCITRKKDLSVVYAH